MIYNDHRAKHTSCVRLAELQCSDGQGYHFRRHRCSYFVPAKLQSIHSHLQDLETQPPSLPLLASPSTYMTCARITPSLITASPPNPLTTHLSSMLTAHRSQITPNPYTPSYPALHYPARQHDKSTRSAPCGLRRHVEEYRRLDGAGQRASARKESQRSTHISNRSTANAECHSVNSIPTWLRFRFGGYQIESFIS